MLSYQYNSISAIEHVQRCPELVFLDFYANSLASLQGLHGLSRVRVLMLGRNNISCLTGALPLCLSGMHAIARSQHLHVQAPPSAVTTSLHVCHGILPEGHLRGWPVVAGVWSKKLSDGNCRGIRMALLPHVRVHTLKALLMQGTVHPSVRLRHDRRLVACLGDPWVTAIRSNL